MILCALHSLQASSASVALLRLLFQSYVAVELAYASTWALFDLLEHYRTLDIIFLTPGFRHLCIVDDDRRKQSVQDSRECARPVAKILLPRLSRAIALYIGNNSATRANAKKTQYYTTLCTYNCSR